MRSLLKGYGARSIFNLKSWDYLDKLMPKKGQSRAIREEP